MRSGGSTFPIQRGQPLREWATAPDIDRPRAMDLCATVDVAIDTMVGRTLPTHIRVDYLDSYEGDGFVESMR